MAKLFIVSHPEVVINASVPITDWGLSDLGRTRAETFARTGTLSQVTAFWSSAERKARDTAEILASALGVAVSINPNLGENDRTATGFLPGHQFDAAADAFFAAPASSFRGWETAHDAQKRIVSAVRTIASGHDGGDLAILTHGAVGTLLWCHLACKQIDRQFDQPSQGHYWQADIETLTPDFWWRAIA